MVGPGAGIKVHKPPTRRAAVAALGGLTLFGSRGWAGEGAAAADIDASFVLLDGQSGEVLDGRGIDRLRIPASLAKIPSLCAAHEVLGGSTRFSTRLAYHPPAASGRSGALVLSGDDPTLDVTGLGTLIAGFRAGRQDDSVPYDLIVDPGMGPQLAEITSTQAQAAPYNPGISGLALNFNRVLVRHTEAGSRSEPPQLGAYWAVGQPLRASNIRFTTAGADVEVPTVRREGGVEIWAIPRRFEGIAELPVGDPAAGIHAAFIALARDPLLNPRYLPDGYRALSAGPSFAPPPAVIESGPLSEVVRGCLHYSTNLTAEMLGISAAQAGGQKPAGPADAGTFALSVLARRYRHINWHGANLENCSGLGTKSALSVAQIAGLLLASPDFSALLKPVGPVEVGGLGVKTGTMAYVRGLAGRFTNVQGRSLIFAILASDDAARAELDAVRPPSPAIPARSRLWLAAAKQNEKILLAKWGLPAAALAALFP